MKEYVVVKNLIKNYGEFCAVDNLSFSVKEGEIFGLLGPNGAGKSTTMNIITSLSSQNKGSITINDLDIDKDRKKVKALIGMVPQDIAVYDFLTAYENVEFFASLYGLRGTDLKEAALEALEFVGLTDRAKLKAKKMSGGMKRRLNIACGIAHRPKLIIMDEPTVGVDAQSRDHILESIKILKERGTTVIYTSHYMNEVEEICDRIAIVDHGKLIACGTKKELIALTTDTKTYRIKYKVSKAIDRENVIKEMTKLAGVVSLTITDNHMQIGTNLDFTDITLLFEYLKKNKIEMIAINTILPDLETVFLALTGREMR